MEILEDGDGAGEGGVLLFFWFKEVGLGLRGVECGGYGYVECGLPVFWSSRTGELDGIVNGFGWGSHFLVFCAGAWGFDFSSSLLFLIAFLG